MANFEPNTVVELPDEEVEIDDVYDVEFDDEGKPIVMYLGQPEPEWRVHYDIHGNVYLMSFGLQLVSPETFVTTLLQFGVDNGTDEFYVALTSPNLDKSILETMSAIANSLVDKYDFDKIESLDAAIQRRISDLCTPPATPHALQVRNADMPEVVYKFHRGPDLGQPSPKT